MIKVKQNLIITLTLLISLSSVFIFNDKVHASSNLIVEATDYTYYGTSPNTGTDITHRIYKLNMDDKRVFCIESGIYTNNGDGYIPEEFNSTKKDILSKIAYYGYTMTNKTDYDYAITQILIWGEIGDKFINTNVPNFEQRKSEIMSLVNNHNILPSWANQEFDIEAGKSITLTDTNNVFNKMSLTSNSTNTSLIQSGNSLTITADKLSESGNITYQKISDVEIGASIVYKKPSHQTLVEFHLDNSVQTSLKINVSHFNDFQIKKLNEIATLTDSNGYSFEYSGNGKGAIFTLEDELENVIQEVTVDDTSIASFTHIPMGVFYLKEIQTSSSDFILPEKIIKVVSSKNSIQFYDGDILLNTNDSNMLEINNDLVKGRLEIIKLDGDSQQVLKDAKINIYDEAMNLITTAITDEAGRIIVDELIKGIYFIKEEASPFGYQLSDEIIKVEISQNDEIVKVEMLNYKIVTILPETGDTSLFRLIILGSGLIVTGAITFIYKFVKTRKK